MADILHFETDDYIFGEFCYHINTDTVHLHAELYFMTVYFFSTVLRYEISLSKHSSYRQIDGS